MTRQNGSIIGEKIVGSNQPGMWTPSDIQERVTTGEWGNGLGTIRYLLVGGGGGGGGARPNEINSGGGGGGGIITGTEILYEGRFYSITTGSGGPAGSTYTPGSRGGYSTFEMPLPGAPPLYPGTSFRYVAYGGGGGFAYDSPTANAYGASGGGASSYTYSSQIFGGLNPTLGTPTAGIPAPQVPAIFPEYVPGTTQGYNGGAANTPPNDSGGAGGGGAGGNGGNASGQSGGAGGIGLLSNITGSNLYYAGGGGGGGPAGGGNGGSGGGGRGGGPVPPTEGKPGSDATFYGGGGGGAATRPGNPAAGLTGGKGYPGICIIRYPNAFELDLSSCPTAPTDVVNGAYSIRIMDEGNVGSDHYVAIGGPAPNIKFKRK